MNHEMQGEKLNTKNTKRNVRGYPKYKPSGVEWLGEVPEHWGVKRLKFIGTSLIGLTYSPEDIVDEDFNGQKYLVLRSTNIQDGKISLHENVYVTTKIVDELKVRKWDILICARNGSRHLVGKNALITEDNEDMTFGAFTTVYRSKVNSFLFYYFASHQFQYQSTGFLTTTINQLTNGNLNSILATLPPLPEQHAIAAFLDRETSRIDTLVGKKKKLVELLREKRTALISLTVTKGLDASVKMKPSGVEWIGEVPDHWGIKALRYICRIETGDKDTVDAEDDGEYPFFVRSQTVERINTYTKNCEAVLTAGDGVGVGKVFHYVNGKFDFHQRVYMFSNFKKVTGRFFYLFLKENFWRVALEGGAKSTVDSLRRPMISSFPFIIPPRHEQRAIAAFLDRETAKIDTLVSKVEAAIEKLKEYRTALISAAVTGKIDVREAV